MAFNPTADIPSLAGKVILVTGGTDGLGRESVRELSLHSPAHIYLAGRNRTKAEKVLAELKDAHPNHAPITFLEMDLNNLASVKTAAARFLTENNRLDILMCNAGVSCNPAVTQDGYEMAFGCNHIAHALLIQLLLPILQKTAEIPGADVRVVSLSSVAEKFAPKKYTFSTMKSNLSTLGLMTRYGQSKLAKIHYTALLARRYPNITFTAVHPGAVKTNFGNSMFEGRPIIEFLCHLILPHFMTVFEVGEGAKGQLWCATAKKETIENGAFYFPGMRLGKGSARSKDMNMAQELWDWTHAELKDYFWDAQTDKVTPTTTLTDVKESLVQARVEEIVL